MCFATVPRTALRQCDDDLARDLGDYDCAFGLTNDGEVA